jgi:hypothetical protein
VPHPQGHDASISRQSTYFFHPEALDYRTGDVTYKDNFGALTDTRHKLLYNGFFVFNRKKNLLLLIYSALFLQYIPGTVASTIFQIGCQHLISRNKV